MSNTAVFWTGVLCGAGGVIVMLVLDVMRTRRRRRKWGVPDLDSAP